MKNIRQVIPWIILIIASFLIMMMFVAIVNADVVSIAQSQIGFGETGGNNKGMYIRQYLGGREGLPWCAGFVSYCLKKSGTDISYTLRAKDFLKLGKKASHPQAGDIVVFGRKGGGHVGIIEKVNKNSFISIEGNTGDFPSKVKRLTHKLNEKNILGFVRLSKARES